MDIWQLSVFHKVIELSSFSEAAKAVRISQPTVSSHIKNLEEYFGCVLIDRVEKKAIPTKAGELLYKYAKKLIQLRNEAEDAIANFQGKLQGSLSIAASTIPGGYILPKLIGEFRDQFQDITISMAISDSKTVNESVISGEVELGIVGSKKNSTKLEYQKLAEDELVLVIPSDHKWCRKKTVTFDELKQEPFIVRGSGSGTQQSFKDLLEKEGLSPKGLRIVAEFGSTTAVIQGIKNRLGISVLSPISIAEDINSGVFKILKLRGLSFRRNFYAVRNGNRTPSPLCDVFFEFLKERSIL